MRIINLFLTSVVIGLFAAAAFSQNAAPYKLAAIHIIPYEQSIGKFESEIRAGTQPGYINELSKSLFVVVEVSGKEGEYAAGRKVTITVTQGKKPKASRSEELGLIGTGGRFYIPIFLHAPMCDDIVITARLTGQRTPSTLTRKIQFDCGE